MTRPVHLYPAILQQVLSFVPTGQRSGEIAQQSRRNSPDKMLNRNGITTLVPPHEVPQLLVVSGSLVHILIRLFPAFGYAAH